MKKISGKLTFLLCNLLIAIVLIGGISYGVLSWLGSYTQHGSFIAVPAFNDFLPEEAHAIARKARLRVQVIDSLYDENAKPGAVVEQYPAAGSHVKENRLIHLTVNARSPEKVVFPNLQNAAYRQTLQTLQVRGFRIGHIEYVPSEFKNLVLALKNNDREVQPGEMLSKGAVIDIVLGSGEGNNLVFVPRFTGKRLREAIDMARKAYLNIGEIIPDGSITRQTDQTTAFVYGQNPDTTQMVEAGTPIEFYITLNEKKLVAADSVAITE